MFAGCFNLSTLVRWWCKWSFLPEDAWLNETMTNRALILCFTRAHSDKPISHLDSWNSYGVIQPLWRGEHVPGVLETHQAHQLQRSRCARRTKVDAMEIFDLFPHTFECTIHWLVSFRNNSLTKKCKNIMMLIGHIAVVDVGNLFANEGEHGLALLLMRCWREAGWIPI